MKNIYRKVQALMDRATHPNTVEEEGRTCAFLAIKLIKQHNLKFVNEIETKIEYDPIPDWQTQSYDSVDIKEVVLFKATISKSKGICKACNKSFNKDEIVAYAHNKGSTHYKCRGFWT